MQQNPLLCILAFIVNINSNDACNTFLFSEGYFFLVDLITLELTFCLKKLHGVYYSNILYYS